MLTYAGGSQGKKLKTPSQSRFACKEIDRSRPFFVCLLGSRYGWVPENAPTEESFSYRQLQSQRQLSITNLEIIHAVSESLSLSQEKKLPPCQHSFFYFRDPECLPSTESDFAHGHPEYLNAFFERSPDRAKRLDELKAWIRTEHPDRVFDYTGEWDAGAQP